MGVRHHGRGMANWRGGARVGMWNATWPFASLDVSRSALVLSVWLLGKFTLSPQQVVAVEPWRSLPLIGNGVRIRHSIARYPETLIFWCFVDPEEVTRKLRELGYPGAIENVTVP